jgi:hypothetical protein
VIDSCSATHARPRVPGYVVLAIAAFVLGWGLGVAVVFKLWQLAHAPRWMVTSGMGTVSFLMAPCLGGVLFARATGRLAARGWRGAPLGLVGLGACGLVAGLLAL